MKTNATNPQAALFNNVQGSAATDSTALPLPMSPLADIINSSIPTDHGEPLEKFPELLNILQYIASLNLEEKVQQMKMIDGFFAKNISFPSSVKDKAKLEIPLFILEDDEEEADPDECDILSSEARKAPDIIEIEDLLRKHNYPHEVVEFASSELKQLESATYRSSDRYKQYQFLRRLLTLPWDKEQEETLDLVEAKTILDESHYGMVKAKDRILEYLAVRKNTRGLCRQPILCLVGPPGVGKSTIGESIAEAMGRKFLRFSVGGMDDEMLIKGCHRTYSASKCGRIMELLDRAGVNNPVIMIHEIDKLCVSRQGDPAAALLEVLDPELNSSFVDHYFEMPFDLSNVFFIATANSLNITEPLLNRMEVIELPGYNHEEKLEIAKHYIVPRCINGTGLHSHWIKFSDEALEDIIKNYTAEPGIRGLSQQIDAILRKIVREKLEHGPFEKYITPESVRDYLGQPKVNNAKTPAKDEIGIAYGLAVGSYCGCVKPVEALLFPGKGQFKFTGNVGETMQESAEAALSFIKSRADVYGIPHDFFESRDIHIHAPEGGIAKDGPSAGVTLATALISAVLDIPVKHEVAMTGEINLRGQVLPIGGVSEKLLAAYHDGKTTVILPSANAADLEQMPQKVLKTIKIVWADTIDDVLKEALTRAPIFAPKLW